MDAVPVGCVVRSCVEEATAVLRDVADGHSHRRQQLRRATRTTPRRGYVTSSIRDLPDDAHAARALMHAVAGTLPPCPVSDLHRRIARIVPRGFAAAHLASDDPEPPNHATGARMHPAPSEHLLADLELESTDHGRRLIGVRPWLSTLLGCDAPDESAHRLMLAEHLATRIGGRWGYLAAIPSGDWPMRRRVRERLEHARSALGAHTLRIYDVGKQPPPIAFGWDAGSTSIRAYDARSGLPMRVLLPVAANLRGWPAWLLGWIEDQDRVRLALHRALSSEDLGDGGTLHEPSTIGDVALGRPRRVLAPGCTRQEVLEACDLVAGGGLVAVRQARTDRGFVADRRRDAETLVDTVVRESCVHLVVEAPPSALAEAYEAGEPHHVETVTWSASEGAPAAGATPHGVLASSTSGLSTPWAAGSEGRRPSSVVLDARSAVTRSTVVPAARLHELAARTDHVESAVTLRAVLATRPVADEPDLRDRLATALASCGLDDLDHAALEVAVACCTAASRSELEHVARTLRDAGLPRAGALWRGLMAMPELRFVLLHPSTATSDVDAPGLLEVAVALARLQSELGRETTWPDLLRRVAVALLRTEASTSTDGSSHAR